MVDMENRVEYTEYDETNPLLQARHRMESRYRKRSDRTFYP